MAKCTGNPCRPDVRRKKGKAPSPNYTEESTPIAINIPSYRILWLPYKLTVNPLDEAKDSKPSPATGFIKNVIAYFPDGCNQLVELFVNHKSGSVIPESDEGIALNNVTQEFEVNYPVELDDSIEVRLVNSDTASHTLTILLGIARVEK